MQPKRAFTLIELLVVIAIIGLILTMAVVALNSVRVKARNAERLATVTQYSKAFELYYSDHASYPDFEGLNNFTCLGNYMTADLNDENACWHVGSNTVDEHQVF